MKKTEYRRSYNRQWLNARLAKMPEKISSTQVRDLLKISERTLRYWRTHPEVEAAQIVEASPAGALNWDANKLRLWLIVKGSIKQPEKRFQQNPPQIESVDQALKLLGLERAEE